MQNMVGAALEHNHKNKNLKFSFFLPVIFERIYIFSNHNLISLYNINFSIKIG